MHSIVCVCVCVCVCVFILCSHGFLYVCASAYMLEYMASMHMYMSCGYYVYVFMYVCAHTPDLCWCMYVSILLCACTR